MLHELHIEDLGVIASLDLVLGDGLTVLTGETGAGKTMLVEAISLLVGGRAEPTMVRAGAEEARVEARFIVGDEELVLARVIPASGRSRAYVNGRLATVATLVEHGSRLVDLHGQHAHQSLLAPSTQRDALDRFAGVDLGPLRAARAHLTEIDASLAALGGDARTRAREIDLLRFQIDELDAAHLDDPDEERTLEADEDVLAGAVAHREAAAAAVAALHDDSAALDGLRSAIAVLAARAPFAALVERLRSTVAEVDDVAAELRDLAESIEDDPERLAAIRERRQLLRNLRRKYGDSLADVIEFRDVTRARLDELDGYEASVQRLERDRTTALADERASAAVVGRGRRGGAGRLASAIRQHLHRLGMGRAELVVTVGDDDPGDDVVLLLAANPGSPPLPLAKVASGGELARAMLALRLVLLESPETLVFDEVDAGIGGSAAIAVGAALAELGATRQVLVVTHLAQVAAQADAQVAVSKSVHRNVTTAVARLLDDDARVGEIARMLSGDESAPTARAHAAELLEGALRGTGSRGGARRSPSGRPGRPSGGGGIHPSDHGSAI
jgi:DNA repair protein RecN (Recombination protein N)